MVLGAQSNDFFVRHFLACCSCGSGCYFGEEMSGFEVVEPPESGEIRVWHVQNVPNKAEHYQVSCWEEAIALLDTLITDDLNNQNVFSNAFGMEEYDATLGWSEWYDELGDDIMHIYAEVYEEDCED